MVDGVEFDAVWWHSSYSLKRWEEITKIWRASVDIHLVEAVASVHGDEAFLCLWQVLAGNEKPNTSRASGQDPSVYSC